MDENKKVLILVVEDEKILADTLKERLESEGFKVTNAYDGLEGYNLAITEHPDLILLDLLLPKVDGLSMLKKLREDSWGLHAKIIILTNVSDPTKVAEGMKIGVGDVYEYLVKTNWSLDYVVARIKKRLKI